MYDYVDRPSWLDIMYRFNQHCYGITDLKPVFFKSKMGP